MSCKRGIRAVAALHDQPVVPANCAHGRMSRKGGEGVG